ncbi:MAG TPA: hypothetical protein VGH87_10195 [Polyangiaceae bacterium]
MKTIFFIACVCVACGGRIDDGDGGTGGVDASTKKDAATNDVATLPDASMKPNCKLGMGSGTVSSDGTCSSTQAWSCGELNFSITCDCPTATCKCVGGDPKTIPAAAACPKCDVMGNLEQLAAQCGFPAP